MTFGPRGGKTVVLAGQLTAHLRVCDRARGLQSDSRQLDDAQYQDSQACVRLCHGQAVLQDRGRRAARTSNADWAYIPSREKPITRRARSFR